MPGNAAVEVAQGGKNTRRTEWAGKMLLIGTVLHPLVGPCHYLKITHTTKPNSMLSYGAPVDSTKNSDI